MSENSKDIRRTSGIYLCRCVDNDRCYVGQSKDLYIRINHAHIPQLRGNRHGNNYMQHSWNKYGESSFEWEVLEYCPVELLNEREKYWIEKLNTQFPNGFNLTTGGDNLYSRSEVSRERMRDTWNDERKHKQSRYNLERWNNMSENQYLTIRQKFVDSWTDDRRELISSKKKDYWNTLSDDARDRFRQKIKDNHADFKGSNHPQARKIQCIETGEIYGSLKDASEILHINYSTLRSHLQGRCKHANNFHFTHIE